MVDLQEMGIGAILVSFWLLCVLCEGGQNAEFDKIGFSRGYFRGKRLRGGDGGR